LDEKTKEQDFRHILLHARQMDLDEKILEGRYSIIVPFRTKIRCFRKRGMMFIGIDAKRIQRKRKRDVGQNRMCGIAPL